MQIGMQEDVMCQNGLDLVTSGGVDCDRIANQQVCRNTGPAQIGRSEIHRQAPS